MADIDTKKVLTAFDAVMIAEGTEEASEERQLEAWQHLVDTGLAWQLQGWFGRNATRLIELGYVKPPGAERTPTH